MGWICSTSGGYKIRIGVQNFDGRHSLLSNGPSKGQGGNRRTVLRRMLGAQM
jgi:hypothetical protein